MRKLFRRRRPTELLLDCVFAIWAVSILVTGNVLPSALTSLFQNGSPAVAHSEPPHKAPELQPLPPET